MGGYIWGNLNARYSAWTRFMTAKCALFLKCMVNFNAALKSFQDTFNFMGFKMLLR